jgi:hypothetical protein
MLSEDAPPSRSGARPSPVSARGFGAPPANTPRVTRHVFPPTVESLDAEIGRIVAERQALRESGADAVALEENRRRLAAAQARLSQLLIDRHVTQPRTA